MPLLRSLSDFLLSYPRLTPGATNISLLRSFYRRELAVLFFCIVSFTVEDGNAFAQNTLPRAGRNFTFGIIEGPENLPSFIGSDSSILVLTAVSPYEGCGVITSPNGYTQQFTFKSHVATVLALPLGLMHLSDLGKTNKGLLVHTSEPINLTFHDFAPEAGDATQIYPDEALDTSYIVCEWGLYNDLGENNHCEILVTAKDDGTMVTIVPTVRTMLGQPVGVPFTVTLNRGECYIVKADTGAQPITTSLSGSTVSASAPVSVIAGTTCAYVPLKFESCNEVMDESIGKKWWGTHFFIQPLGNDDSTSVVVITGDRPFFATVNQSLSGSTGNRIQLAFTGTAEIVTTAPVEVDQFTRGSDFASITDPTMVTILDTSHYADTMIFNSPNFSDFPSLPANDIFTHWVPIIFPTSQANVIFLDGLSLSNYPQSSSVINGSTMSAINLNVGVGVHTLYSPVPIFALATGFAEADAYSFIPGTVGAYAPRDTLNHTLVFTPEAATTCTDFGVDVSLDTAFSSLENVISVELTFTYDSTTLLLAGIEPHAILQNAIYTVDSSIPGKITIDIFGTPLITGKDLFRIVFAGKKVTGSTSLAVTMTVTACSDAVERIVSHPGNFSIVVAAPVIDSSQTTLSISTSPVTYGDQASADVTLSGLPANAQINTFDLYLTYNHDVLTYVSSVLNGTIANGWTASAPESQTPNTDKITFTSNGTPLSISGILAHLLFQTFVADSASTPIVVASSLPDTNGKCPAVYQSPLASTLFLGKNLCGDTTIRAFMQRQIIVIQSAQQSTGNDLDVTLLAGKTEDVNYSLTNVLGQTVLTGSVHCSERVQTVSIALPAGIPSGAYLLRVEANRSAASRKVVLMR